MKQKQKLKLALDVIMLLLSVTFYSKNLISLSYHEIAGLILIGIFVLHIVINLKSISVMCRKFGKVPAETKAGVVVDFLLILCFAWIGISGIMISKTILTGISSNHMVFKLGHMFAGGLSVVLLGVHIGLHLGFRRFPAAVSVLLTAVVLCGGIYGAVNSSQLRWLSIPFSASQTAQGPEGQRPDGGAAAETDREESAHEKPAQQTEAGDDSAQAEDSAGQAKERTDGTAAKDGETEARSGGTPGRESGAEGRLGRDGESGAEGREKGGAVPLSQKAENVWMFFSMILSCAAVTYWIVRAKKAIQAKKKA